MFVFAVHFAFCQHLDIYYTTVDILCSYMMYWSVGSIYTLSLRVFSYSRLNNAMTHPLRGPRLMMTFHASLVSGELDAKPSFTMEVGLVHFQSTFQDSNGPQYSSVPAWVLETMPRPEIMTEFNISPVMPSLIKRFLRKLPNASAPGPDRISYLHLKKLPSTHHFLATLFSNIILTNHRSPTIWCKGILRLIHKGGDTESLENFCPIALTSCVGKLLHRILASRLVEFMMANNIINPELQKGFLSGNPKVFEHVLSLNAIIDNAKQHSLPLSMTFIDLRNAFGSVPNKLISDMLHHIYVPVQLQEYVSHTYSKLTAEIHTDNWKSPPFQISRGVFQGDTLSPLLFLLSFNPIISYIDHFPTCGSQMSLQLPDTAGLPPANSHIYLFSHFPSSHHISLCRFKGLRTVTAQIISIGLRTWVSPVYRAPYAVMKLRFFRNQKHTAIITYISTIII